MKKINFKLIRNIFFPILVFILIVIYYNSYSHRDNRLKTTEIKTRNALFLGNFGNIYNVEFNQKTPRNLFAKIGNALLLIQFCDHYGYYFEAIECISEKPINSDINDFLSFKRKWIKKLQIMESALAFTNYSLADIPASVSGNNYEVKIKDKNDTFQNFYIAKNKNENWYFTDENYTSPTILKKYNYLLEGLKQYKTQSALFLSSPMGSYAEFILGSQEKFGLTFEDAKKRLELDWVNPLIKKKYSRFIAHILIKVLEKKRISINSVTATANPTATRYLLCLYSTPASSIFMSKKRTDSSNNDTWWFSKKTLKNAVKIFIGNKGIAKHTDPHDRFWYIIEHYLNINPGFLYYNHLLGIPYYILLNILFGFFVLYISYKFSKMIIGLILNLVWIKKSIHHYRRYADRLNLCSALIISIYCYDYLMSYPYMYYYKPYLFYSYLLIALYGVLLIWWLCEAVNLTCSFLRFFLEKIHKNKFQTDFIVEIIKRLSIILIIIIFTGILLQNLGVPMANFLTGLGIGGLALALAGKDTIENLFGSIMISLEKPFDIGDWIVIGKIEGYVEHIGLRSTRIRAFDDSYLTIPNVKFITTDVNNMGKRTYRRYKTSIKLEHSTSADLILSLTEGITELIMATPCMRKRDYYIRVNNFGKTSLDVMIWVFFLAPNWTTELREREHFILNIKRLIEELNIKLAYPMQTLYLAKHKETNIDDNSDLSTEQLSIKTTQAKSTARKIAKKFMGDPHV